MKSFQSNSVLILLVCLLVSSAWLATGCQSPWLPGVGTSGVRSVAPGSTVATGSPQPADNNPRNRIAGPGRKVVPPNVAEPFWRHWHDRPTP
jgi:hypothetical protein